MSTVSQSPSELDVLAPMVGPAWNGYYKDRFEELAQGGSIVGWNAAAALAPLWGVRRRIPVLSGLSLSFPIIGFFLAALVSLTAGLLVPTVLFALAHGLLGDWIYYRHLESVRRRLATITDERKRKRLIAKSSVAGPIESGLAALLGVPMALLVIISGVPHVDHRTNYVATVKADLRNLDTAQEGFYADSGYFAATMPTDRYATSSGVTVNILYADSTSWGAEGRHVSAGVRCEYFVGKAMGLRLATQEFEPACEGAGTERH